MFLLSDKQREAIKFQKMQNFFFRGFKHVHTKLLIFDEHPNFVLIFVTYIDFVWAIDVHISKTKINNQFFWSDRWSFLSCYNCLLMMGLFSSDNFTSARIDLLLGFMFFDHENFGTDSAGYEIYFCGFVVCFQSSRCWRSACVTC